MTDAIPGARILVYDQALDEIGDGAGGLVPLDQALVANDILACCSRSASAPALLATRSPRSAPDRSGLFGLRPAPAGVPASSRV